MRIEIIDYKDRKQVYSSQKTKLLIGRSTECDIVLDSSQISRKHAILESTSQGLFIEDLGSKNGIQVNDMPILPNGRKEIPSSSVLKFSQLFTLKVLSLEAIQSEAKPKLTKKIDLEPVEIKLETTKTKLNRKIILDEIIHKDEQKNQMIKKQQTKRSLYIFASLFVVVSILYLAKII